MWRHLERRTIGAGATAKLSSADKHKLDGGISDRQLKRSRGRSRSDRLPASNAASIAYARHGHARTIDPRMYFCLVGGTECSSGRIDSAKAECAQTQPAVLDIKTSNILCFDV
jgi:hypothetical protein